jgi:hypothetical protein
VTGHTIAIDSLLRALPSSTKVHQCSERYDNVPTLKLLLSHDGLHNEDVKSDLDLIAEDTISAPAQRRCTPTLRRAAKLGAQKFTARALHATSSLSVRASLRGRRVRQKRMERARVAR